MIMETMLIRLLDMYPCCAEDRGLAVTKQLFVLMDTSSIWQSGQTLISVCSVRTAVVVCVLGHKLM